MKRSKDNDNSQARAPVATTNIVMRRTMSSEKMEGSTVSTTKESIVRFRIKYFVSHRSGKLRSEQNGQAHSLVLQWIWWKCLGNIELEIKRITDSFIITFATHAAWPWGHTTDSSPAPPGSRRPWPVWWLRGSSARAPAGRRPTYPPGPTHSVKNTEQVSDQGG